MDIKFCTQCGSPVIKRIPENDTHERYVCTHCRHTHYQNPKIITGCLVYQENRVMLCKRAIEPRFGLWTIPAGFMENSENTKTAAVRETHEESGASIKFGELFFFANLPRVNHVYILYLAELLHTQFNPGSESSEIKLYTENQLPWDNLAFYSAKVAIECFYKDLKHGKFILHEMDF